MTATAENENNEREFGWLSDAWFCGSPEERCRHCGRPVLFVPVSLELQTCTCGSAAPETDFPAGTNPAARLGTSKTAREDRNT